MDTNKTCKIHCVFFNSFINVCPTNNFENLNLSIFIKYCILYYTLHECRVVNGLSFQNINTSLVNNTLVKKKCIYSNK